MRTVHATALAFVLVASGCNRSQAGGGDAGSSSASPGSPAAAEKAGELPSLADFEGEVDLLATSTKMAAPVPLSLLVKNETLRIDAPDQALAAPEARSFTGGGKVYAIIKPADKKTTIVLDGKREAVVLNLDTLADQTKSFRQHAPGGGGDKPPEPPKVVKTGKKETVAGYACEDWQVTNADRSKATVCVAEKGTSFFHFPSLGIPSEHAWALELVDGKHFPLKIVGFEKDGSEAGRLEVTKIDKHPLDAAMFQVPAGYKQLTLDEMIQSLANGGGATPEVPHAPHGGGGHGHHHPKAH